MAETARPRFISPCLALLGLWALAVVQPLYDLLQRSPEFFVAHGAGTTEILAVVVVLGLLVPLALGTLVWIAGRAAHRAVVAVLVAAVAIQIAKQFGVQSSWIAMPLAAAGGVAGAYAYHRSAVLQRVASVLSMAAVLVPLIFLTHPGISALVFPSQHAVRTEPAAPTADSTKTPVVLIVIDETSLVSLIDAEGRIDPVLYPYLARLAREGMWFRNATTVADFTRWAVPAILSGKYPEPELLPHADHHPDNLFTLLSRTHRMEVLESVTRLCPREICPPPAERLETRLDALARDLSLVYLHIVSPNDLRARLPSVTEDWAGFVADQTTRRRRERRASSPRSDNHQIALTFAEWISSDDAQPTFYFLHTLLPHSPWQWLPSGQRNATRAPVPADLQWSWGDDEWAVTQYYQRHLLQIGLVDTVLGRIIGRLEAAGLYDRTAIVVTADHGVAFRPGEHRRNFSEQAAADIMRVPLLLKVPSTISTPPPDVVIGGQRISDRNVETIDIAPTLAQAAGIPLTWEADGQSLLDATAAPRTSKKIYFASAQQVRTFGPEGPPAALAVERKLATFGGAENLHRVPRPARFAELVGRPLAEMRIEDGGGEMTIAHLQAFDRVNARAEMIPFDVAGESGGSTPGGSPTFIAVAVNGTIRAVTRTWTSEPRKWLATPPLDAWRDGANDLQVFVVDADSRGPLLRRTRLSPRPAASLPE